jgi:cell wall assembly regulator SMI1
VAIEAVWREIDEWLKDRAPAVYRSLAGPASSAVVRDAERALAMDLPAELRASLAIHDGEYPNESWMFSNWSLLPTVQIVRSWRAEHSRPRADVDADGYVRAVVWSRRWLPFAYDGSGGHLVVDLDPPATGTVGQIVMTSHDGPNRRVAETLHDFLERYLAALRAESFQARGSGLETRRGHSRWWARRADA